MQIPNLQEPLNKDQIELLKTFSKSCRHSIIKMLITSQSGHPGGSLSSLDYLTTLYAFILSQTGEKIVISNGHISPAIYSILGEMGYVDKEDAIQNFRRNNSKFEGHVNRHVEGVCYGTGPLGIGVSAAAAFALSEKLKNSNKKTYAIMGDGEVQEGQVFEMINFTSHHKLNNLILFVDFNKVQLTSSLKEIQNINVPEIFRAGGFKVIETDGHDYEKIWEALKEANAEKEKPVVIIGETIMGKGVPFMEKDGAILKSDWHGKPPAKEEGEEVLKGLELTKEEIAMIEEFKKSITWKPTENEFKKLLSEEKINTGSPILYEKDAQTDCRTAYGKALEDLAKLNPNILALTADLKSSVMTKFVSSSTPNQYVECGIAEQNMITVAGGLSLDGWIPFASTFGAFISSRAKDQARMNDINNCNVKMVATHCGLSVGEDGPSHQAIDDSGSFLGMYNTMTIEPVDPNHADRIIRYIASHYGNFYVRMGRHKVPVLTKENGDILYDANYKYEYGKCDLLREGNSLTIVATSPLVYEALVAKQEIEKENSNIKIEIVIASSIKKFDDTLLNSIKKTKRVLTLEDHNPSSGLGSQVAKFILENNITIEKFETLGTVKYEMSGKPQELYASAGLDKQAIIASCKHVMSASE
jgi:transketolase